MIFPLWRRSTAYIILILMVLEPVAKLHEWGLIHGSEILDTLERIRVKISLFRTFKMVAKTVKTKGKGFGNWDCDHLQRQGEAHTLSKMCQQRRGGRRSGIRFFAVVQFHVIYERLSQRLVIKVVAFYDMSAGIKFISHEVKTCRSVHAQCSVAS